MALYDINAALKPPESPMDQYARLMQLRSLANQQQLQQQQLANEQLQNQTQQLGLKQQQQQMADNEAFRQYMASPEAQGQTLGEAADALARSGHISAASWQALKKADLDHRKGLADLNKTDLENYKAAHDQTQQLFNNAMNMPDPQLSQNWPQIAQQYNAIPGNEKMPLDPNQPLNKQQLSQFGPFLSMGNAYFDQELARRGAIAETAGKEANTAKTQMEVKAMQQFGGLTGPMMEAKAVDIRQKLATGQPVAPQDKAWFDAYNKQKLMVPQTVANIRLEGYNKMRQYPVFDTQTGQTQYMDPEQITIANAQEPGRYRVPQYTPEAIGQKTTTTYFTSGSGGKQLTAFNTAITHLDTLDRLAGDLKNGDVRVFNKAAQEWAVQTGNAAPANFEAAKNAMSGEVAQALKASGATDQEISHVGSTFDRAQSPAQLKGAINTYRELLKSKAQQLQKQYESGMQGKPAFQGQQGKGDPLGIR